MRRLDREHDPKAVHFGLRPQKQTLPFLFVHGTDCHVPRGGKRLFQRFRAEVAALRGKAKLCILTGDLVSFADNYSIQRARADYSFFAAQTRDFPVPLFCTSGNHDATGTRTKGKAEPDHPLYGYGMYWKAVGPLRWSFNAAGHHFVGIDYNTVSNGQWQWGVPPGAAAWLRRDLELAPKGAPVLLFVHSPSGSTEFHHVIDDFKVQHIFCGHTHKSNVFRAGSATVWQGGALTPMIKGIPAGYRIVRITDQGVQTQYVPLGRP